MHALKADSQMANGEDEDEDEESQHTLAMMRGHQSGETLLAMPMSSLKSSGNCN